MYTKNTTIGFTLVETLVALSILSIALAGTYTMISYNLRNANGIQNSFIASGLVQEGLEVVRNLRDTDWLDEDLDFGDLGESAGTPDGKYRVQWNSSKLMPWDPGLLSFDPATGIYQYFDGGTPTIFSRTVEISQLDLGTGFPTELVVKVTVEWTEGSGTKKLQGEEHLFNWY